MQMHSPSLFFASSSSGCHSERRELLLAMASSSGDAKESRFLTGLSRMRNDKSLNGSND